VVMGLVGGWWVRGMFFVLFVLFVDRS